MAIGPRAPPAPTPRPRRTWGGSSGASAPAASASPGSPARPRPRGRHAARGRETCTARMSFQGEGARFKARVLPPPTAIARMCGGRAPTAAASCALCSRPPPVFSDDDADLVVRDFLRGPLHHVILVPKGATVVRSAAVSRKARESSLDKLPSKTKRASGGALAGRLWSCGLAARPAAVPGRTARPRSCTPRAPAARGTAACAAPCG